MPRLLSREKFPPMGFTVLHPEAGMKQPFSGSFREAVDFEYKFRAKNPAIAQRLGLPLDVKACEQYVDEQNALRCLAGGWDAFVDRTVYTPTYSTPAEKKTSLLGRVVAVAKAVKAGIGIWLEAFGSDGKPVDSSLAEKRAAICTGCPFNDRTTGLQNYFIVSVVKNISTVYQMMNQLELTTPHDAQLGVCSICLCPLKSKVFAKLTHIQRHMPADAAAKLPMHCWVKTET